MHKNQELLDTYLSENVTKDVNILKRVVQGDVYPEILHEAKSWKADVIVLASHRPGVSDYLLSSNAVKIMRHAPISVFVAREEERTLIFSKQLAPLNFQKYSFFYFGNDGWVAQNVRL